MRPSIGGLVLADHPEDAGSGIEPQLALLFCLLAEILDIFCLTKALLGFVNVKPKLRLPIDLRTREQATGRVTGIEPKLEIDAPGTGSTTSHVSSASWYR